MGHSDRTKTQTAKVTVHSSAAVKEKDEHTTTISTADYGHLLYQLELMTTRLDNQQSEIAHLRQSRDELFIQLTHFNGLKAQIRSLIAAIYGRLITKIQNIGKFKPLIKAPEFAANDLNDRELQLAVSKYDERAFNQKRTIGGGTGRLISVSLLKLIKLCTRSIKLVVHSLRLVKRTLR